jgi:hypothetical protein
MMLIKSVFSGMLMAEDREDNVEYKEGENAAEKLANMRIGLAVGGLGTACIEHVEKENRELASALMLVNDAITNHAVRDWLSIRSVVSDLTDGNEVNKVVERVTPGSLFYGNRNAVAKLVDRLEYWRKEGVFFNQDSIRKALVSLDRRQAENNRFLQDHRNYL